MWTEQKLWLRALNAPGELPYCNAYLLDVRTGTRPTVDAYTCKVLGRVGEGSEVPASSETSGSSKGKGGRGRGRGRGGRGCGSSGATGKKRDSPVSSAGNHLKCPKSVTCHNSLVLDDGTIVLE